MLILVLVGVHIRTKKTLKQCINSGLNQEQTCNSDCWKAYESVGKDGYNHLVVEDRLLILVNDATKTLYKTGSGK